MKNIILCEGVTDAIVIRYYLEKTKNWQFVKNSNQVNETKDGLFRLPIQDTSSEIANWYKCSDRHLAIWAIGGQSKFDYAIREVMKINRREDAEKGFTKIVIVTDRDKNEQDAPVLQEFQTSLKASGIEMSLQNNAWAASQYKSGFGEDVPFSILTLIIPFDKAGALETFLLDAISEQEEEKKVVEAARSFIAALESEKYLPTERVRLKADLAATFAVLNPERVFTIRDELMRSIRWEEYRTIQTAFQKLEEI